MEQLVLQNPVHQYLPATALTLICGGRVVSLPFDQVIHIQKCGHLALLYTRDSIYKTARSLKEILRDLPVNDFARITSSHIVSLRYVRQFGHDFVSVSNTILPLTNHYKRQLIRLLGWKLNQSYQQFHYASRIPTPL